MATYDKEEIALTAAGLTEWKEGLGLDESLYDSISVTMTSTSYIASTHISFPMYKTGESIFSI